MAATAYQNGDSCDSNGMNNNGNNKGISWTQEEQSILDDLLIKYETQNNLVRYAKIAMKLKDKTIRDVALRIRWMSKKDNGNRRKEDHNPSRKSKDKKDKVTESLPKSSQVSNYSSTPPYPQLMMASMESDDGISYKAIGGITGHLLEQNAQELDQISANFSTHFSAFKIQENINRLCQARNNILTILHDSLNDVPEIMNLMPPLPVMLNEELANSILAEQFHHRL